MSRRAGVEAAPASALIIGSALFQYVGAGIAVGVFDQISPAAVAWWRVAASAVALIVWRRPWRDDLTRGDLWRSTLFGVVILTMNVAFYQAIVTLPLGVAVSLEFLGPVAVAIVAGRGWASRIAAVLACAGVMFIGGLGVDLSDPGIVRGLAWIALSGAAWAGYIVLGRRIAQRRSAVTNLALGCVGGALVYSPALMPQAVVAFQDWRLLGTVIAVGLMSTAIPFTLEAVAMTRLAASTFALLVALEPATSAVVGLVMLGQVPGWGELAGLICVSIAVWLASRPAD